MQTTEWLEAWRAGSVILDWNHIDIRDDRGNHLRLKTLADAARVHYSNSRRIREGAGAEACQLVGDEADALMITPAIYEHRHSNATVRITPAVASLVKPGGNIGNTTAEEASNYIVKLMQQSDDVRAGPWMVSVVGKGFCLCNEIDLESRPGKGASNFGWHVPAADCYQRDGLWWWKGIQVYPSLLYPSDWMYIQRHTDLGHGLDQDDYASQMLLVAKHGHTLNGNPVTGEKLYTDPGLCHLVTHDGKPLKWTRHPGVELVVEISSTPPPSKPTKRATPHAMHRDEIIPPPPNNPTILPPDTEPSMPRWKDETLMHGERKILWLEEQRAMGVCEQPDGSNNGPEISVYHSITKRDGVPNFGPWLAKAGGHWCCSSASYCEQVTRIETDPGPVMTPRAAGWEFERDAKADGTWRPTELILRGEFIPEPGDIGTIQRGKPGSGLRHVFTIKENVPERKGVITIGGNEGNRFGPDTFRKWSSLLGIRECGEPGRYMGEIPYQGEDVEQEPPANMHDDGNNVLEGWGPMDPDPWIPEEWRGVEGCPRRWRTTLDGISVKGEPKPRRTKGKPLTVGKVWLRYQAEIEEAHELTDVPLVNILGMLTTEGGLLEPHELERHEKHLDDWSFGIAQTLTETAFEMGKRLDMQPPRKPVPRGGDVQEWREFLEVPRNSILIGVAYMAYNDERWNLLDDPVLAYAAYNAGSPRVNLDRPWGVHYYRKVTNRGTYDALDTFAAWYGDACEVLG